MLNPGHTRRRLLAVQVVTLFVVPFVVSRSGTSTRSELCAKPTVALRIGDSLACVHSDEAPPGVDVTERPSTADLRDRPGAGEAAYEAAADLGVPTPTEVATTATGPAV